MNDVRNRTNNNMLIVDNKKSQKNAKLINWNKIQYSLEFFIGKMNFSILMLKRFRTHVNGMNTNLGKSK